MRCDGRRVVEEDHGQAGTSADEYADSADDSSSRNEDAAGEASAGSGVEAWILLVKPPIVST